PSAVSPPKSPAEIKETKVTLPKEQLLDIEPSAPTEEGRKPEEAESPKDIKAASPIAASEKPKELPIEKPKSPERTAIADKPSLLFPFDADYQVPINGEIVGSIVAESGYSGDISPGCNVNKLLLEKKSVCEMRVESSEKPREGKDLDLHVRGRRISSEKLAVVFENGFDEFKDKALTKSEIEDCVTSDELSQVSSVYRSDSAKFSETDAEPVSSETESSYKLDIQTMSERSFESAKFSTRSIAYDVESPHTDATEYSVSHIESIIESSTHETKSQSECQIVDEVPLELEDEVEGRYSVDVSEHSLSTTSPSTTIKTQKSKREADSIDRKIDYEVHREDIEMRGDVLKVTMHREDTDKSKRVRSTSTTVGKSKKVVKKSFESKVETKTHTGLSSSVRVKQIKAESDADVSSDDEKKDHLAKGKILKKTASTRSTTEISKDRTSIPRLIKSPIRKVYSSDSTSTDTAVTTTRRYEPKRKQKTSGALPPEPYKAPHVVRKYDNRVHGYMQSTVSRDMKIDKNIREMVQSKKSASYTLYKTKDKKESENEIEKSKQTPRSPKTVSRSVDKHEVKVSAEKKLQRAEVTKTKTRSKEVYKSITETQKETRSITEFRKDVRAVKESSIKRTKEKSPAPLEKPKDSKSTQDKLHNGLPTTVVKTHKIEMVQKIESPKPSASPTKLKRAMPVEEHIRKVSISDRLSSKPSVKPSEIEKPVQDTEASLSRSVTPSTHQEKVQGQVERTPSSSSLPGSPVRVRSANGGTKVLTSEVFTRSHDHAGSIEVIYKQPYDNLKKVASGIREAEFSMIDTTDSSLSESVALPSSPSDHDISSEANGKFKSTSPSSPKRRSLESIHEMKHRVSDLITCALIPEDQGTEDFDEIQKRFALQGKEEALIDLPRRLLSQFEEISESAVSTREQPTDPFRTGTTISVLPETSDVSTHSMAYTVTKEVYVKELHSS
ncbi:hypothetical protein Trydic_g10540, partial [Trypoxylus dichotomus]